MSVGGLGAFAQGLVQGYVTGDKLKSAEEEREVSRQFRELRGLQINEAKEKLATQEELKVLRPKMAEAIGNVLANPTDEAALQNYNITMAQYYTKANSPKDADAFLRAVRDDKLKEGARQAADIFGRLQMQEPTAIADFARVYKAVPTGIDVDPARSGYTKNGFRIGLVNSQTGEVLPDKEISNDQVIQGFARFLGSGKDVVDFYQNNKRLALTERGQNIERDLGIRRNEISAESNSLTAQDRAYRLTQDTIATAGTELERIVKLEKEALETVEAKSIPQAEFDRRNRLLQNRSALAGSLVVLNANNGITPEPRKYFGISQNLLDPQWMKSAIEKGEITVPRGFEGKGIGMYQNFLVPMPQGISMKPNK